MPEKNIEIVRSAIEANRSGPPAETVEKAAELAHPDLEFVSRLTAVDGRTYRGIDGARGYWEELTDAWREWHNELLEVTELDPDTVLTESVFRGTGKSGVDVELRTAMVWTLLEGRVVRMHAYPSRDEALRGASQPE